ELEQPIFGYLNHLLENVRAELPPDDGRDAEHPVALVRQVIEPAPDSRSDPGRDDEAPALLVGRLVEPALGDEEADDLSHEERVPCGLAMDGLDERRIGDHAGHEL